MSEQIVRARFETRNVDEGVAIVREAYPGSEWRAPKDRPFASALSFVGDDRLTLFGMDQRATVDAVFPPQPAFIIGSPTPSALTLEAGRDRIDVARPFLYPHEPLTAHWDEELHLRVVQVDAPTVRMVAAARYGVEPGTLRMTGTAPVSPQLEAFWNAVAAHARQLADDEALFSADLVRNDLLQMVVAAMLTVFPHNLADRVVPHDAAETGAASVRRAISYMEEHVAEPVTLADIAAAARMTPRGLRSVFRHSLDTTPMAYLRRLRLDGARDDLRDGDPIRGVTVAAVAARWGFTDLHRFTEAYLDAYGESPSDTLHS